MKRVQSKQSASLSMSLRVSPSLDVPDSFYSTAQKARWRRALKASLRHPHAQRFGANVHIQLCDASQARALNRDFRNKRYVPNVLSFEYPTQPKLALQSDIAICLPVVQKEAQQQEKLLADHFLHLLVHGFLHAQGYDHLDESQAEIMQAEEKRILARFRIADPY
jgi:probable rRNA maturation factor